MTFQEHNNRKKADGYAEYITGDSLRRLVAAKVHQYCGEHPSNARARRDTWQSATAWPFP